MKFAPKKYRNAGALATQAAAFNEALAAAQNIENPADRIEAMLELQSGVARHYRDVIGDFASRANAFEGAGIVGGVLSVAGVSLVTMVLATPLVGIPVLFAGIIGLVVGGEKYDPAQKMMDRMEKEISGHMDALKDVIKKAGNDIDGLLKNRSNEIAASEKFDSIYDRFPGVRDSFIKTFNKAVARKELPEATAAPNAAPRQKFSL